MLLMVSSLVPKSAKELPLLAFYIMGEMLISACGCCTSVVIMYIHSNAASNRTLPQWLRRFISSETDDINNEQFARLHEAHNWNFALRNEHSHKTLDVVSLN